MKKDLKVLKFPSSISTLERKVEAVLFAAEEPLDEETIKEKLNIRTDISKILTSLEKQYLDRGINLVCISKKWSFRTSPNLSNLMAQEKTVEKKCLDIIMINSIDHIVLVSKNINETVYFYTKIIHLQFPNM